MVTWNGPTFNVTGSKKLNWGRSVDAALLSLDKYVMNENCCRA